MNILDKIIECKKLEVKALRSKYNLNDFSDFVFYAKKCQSLTEKIKSERNIAIIAEVKKASPSKGLIRDDFSHLEIANTYLQSGVSAISVLTDEKFFLGSIQFLIDIAKIKTVPLLRKDFIIDEFQIYEAKAYGADAVLLISEALTKDRIKELTLAAKEIGLEVLLEIHSEIQLGKIDFSLNPLIGINNRNLSNFVTDLNATRYLSALLPEEVVIVSESGINNMASLDTLKQTRTDAVLVGEHFMRMGDIGLGIGEFRNWCIR